MLRLSKKSDYALMAVKHLATRADGGAASAREISEAYAIPLELLAKVLQRLVRARLLVSVQGTRGGYRLGKPAAQISVADVIQAVDGPVTVTACSPDDHACGQFTTCSIRDPLWKIKNRILEMLTTGIGSGAGGRPGAAARAVARFESLSDGVRLAGGRTIGDLPRSSRHHARRLARARGDAAVLHRPLRQRVEPDPPAGWVATTRWNARAGRWRR